MEFSLSEMGKRIAKRRKALKIKQTELADTLNISNNHLSNIERGLNQPSLFLLADICNALQVTPDYLIMGVMRSSDISKSVTDMLSLCTDDDKELVLSLVKIMAEKNSNNWNKHNYI